MDLTWVCGGNPAGVEVLSETRPPNAYRLRGSDVNGTWTQELLIRPTASGTLKPAGTPSGAKLKFHLTSASYGTWSTSNVNPADLPKLP